MTIVLLTSVFPVELFPNAPPSPKGIDGQYSGRQGQVVLVKVAVGEEATDVKGTFLDRTIPFFREMRIGERAGYLGLVGIDMQDAPGTYELAVTVKYGEKVQTPQLPSAGDQRKIRGRAFEIAQGQSGSGR